MEKVKKINFIGDMEKRIIIDITHPSFVHMFKYLIAELSQRYFLLVTVRDIPEAVNLLNLYKIPYIHLGYKSDKLTGKTLNLFLQSYRIFKLVKKNSINIGIGASIVLNQVSRITKMKSIFFDDDDSKVQPLTKKFAIPFADYIITPDVLKFENYGVNHFTYPGYQELAYLHPNRFKPDPSVLKLLNINENETFFILRFNEFKAHHDVGVTGLEIKNKRELIKILSKYGKIFITTERDIEAEFIKYQIKVPASKIHSLLYYATMFIGDSQTMTSEAAVLGTPAIRSNSLVGKISYLEELEHKYKLTFGFKPNEINKMFEKINELLIKPNLKEIWKDRQILMLKDKIDVTDFMLKLIESYPKVGNYLKKNIIIEKEHN